MALHHAREGAVSISFAAENLIAPLEIYFAIRETENRGIGPHQLAETH